jgi:hypothetical protein
MRVAAEEREEGRAPKGRGHRRTKAEVVKAMLAREAAGLALNSRAVLDDDERLHADTLRVFGHWDAVLEAIGVEPERVRRHRRWSRAAVIKRIRQRASQGLPLNHGVVCRDEAVLTSAAGRHFGSWDDALVAAGFDPTQYRQRGPTWTRDHVIAAIHEIRHRGGKLNHGHLGRCALSHAAIKLFRSWDAALQAAGLDPDRVRLWRRAWTRQELVQEIQRSRQAGESLKAKDAQASAILRPACRLFGSWNAALEAAGLDVSTIRTQRRPWTRGAILEELRRTHATGGSLNTKRVPSGMCQRARIMFGSWRAALEAAGVDPDGVGIKPMSWTADRIVAELRRMDAAATASGGRIVVSRGFRRAACRLFGSWEAALSAAGLVLKDSQTSR